MIKNPIKFLRKAYADAMVGVPVYDSMMPIDKNDKTYITLDKLELSPIEESKDCYEWQITATINIWDKQQKGFISNVAIDDIEEQLINANLTPLPFKVKHRKLIDSVNMSDEIYQRRVVIERVWINLVKE